MKKMDKMTKKTLTMYGALHPRSDIDGLYLKQKHGGTGLISIETCVMSEENNFGLYVRGSNVMLLKSVKKVSIVKTENLMEEKDFKKNGKNEFKKNGTERECMDSLFVKCRIIRKTVV